MRHSIGLLLVAAACSADPAPFYIPDGGRVAGDAGSRSRGDAAQPDGGVPEPSESARFDPNHVYLLGTFSEGVCSMDAIEDFDPTTRSLAGFYCTAESHRIRADGTWLYLAGVPEASLRRFVPDPWIAHESFVDYPDAPTRNDPVIETPGCATVRDYRLFPDSGEIVYRCGSCSPGVDCLGNWYREDGTPFVLPDDTLEFWLGFDEHAMVARPGHPLAIAQRDEILADVATDLSEFARFYLGIVDVRATVAGFDVFEGGFQLFAVDLEGRVTVAGDYAHAPEGVSRTGCVIAGDRALVCQGDRTRDEDDLVLRYPLGAGAPVVLHDERLDPRVRLHAAELISGR